MTETTKVDTLEVYSSGLCMCSVCAPPDMAKEEVERQTNIFNPTGISSKWTISSNPTFKDGTENGRLQTCSRGESRQWLLSC